MASETKFERLPSIAKPLHYELHLKPYLDKFSFDGDETIELDILKPTQTLKFYSSHLELKEISLKMVDNVTFTNLAVVVNEKFETATIHLPQEIKPCKAYLHIKFQGVLNDKMKGFYRSQYTNSSGKEEYLATTQFESVFARQAFPCWDEPIYKATFDISLTVPTNKTALSNMNEISSEKIDDNWKNCRFARTPVMSTYLVAFIVGDFEYLEGRTSDDVRVRVYTLPGKQDQGVFALDVALKALPFYRNYFGIAYGLPKCDLVAIPDFNAGAMENWGLITYREVLLLLDEKVSSSSAKENIALTVAHELAHMWFGNLATMEWWTDLWLKEGFATWMEYYFVDVTFPAFDIWTQFLNHNVLSAMKLDALKNSHPIEVPINDPDEVEEIYDNVSYCKSASVIRMLHDYLGAEAFQKGLKTYLSKYSFKNAETQNLWECLSESSGVDVSQLMSSWTKFMGFPVVKVSRSTQNGCVIVRLEQERFLVDGSKDESGMVWHVPISICTASSPDKPVSKLLLTKNSDTFTIENVHSDEWLKLNAGFTGFYLVQYSDDMLSSLLKPISEKVLKPHDRLNVCGDLFALVRSGKISTTSFLDVLESYENETDYTVWSKIDSSLDTLSNCIARTDYIDKYLKFIRNQYKNIANQLGWDDKPDEGHTVRLLRSVILRRLGKSGDEQVVNTARKLFYAYVNGQGISPDLRGMVFGTIGEHDGRKGQEQLIKIFEKTTFSEIQEDCLVSISQGDDVELQEKSLAYAFSDKVRLQDAGLVFSGIVESVSGLEIGWNYFKKNMDTMAEKFGGTSSSLFQDVLKTCAMYHCTDEKAKDVDEYFKSKKDLSAGLNRPIQQSLENVRLNISLLKRDQEAIKLWLIKKGY